MKTIFYQILIITIFYLKIKSIKIKNRIKIKLTSQNKNK
jgi:hypothetical protein